MKWLALTIAILVTYAARADILHQRCEAQARKANINAEAVRESCATIETEPSLAVALKGMKHSWPPAAIKAAIKIATWNQAKCALRSLDHDWIEPAVENCLRIQTDEQLEFAIAAMDKKWIPSAATRAATEIRNAIQKDCAVTNLAKFMLPDNAVGACEFLR